MTTFFSDPVGYVLALGLTVFVLSLITLKVVEIYSTIKGRPTAAISSDRVIVNIPPDFKPIAPLPGDTSIEGQKAVLWYTVFQATLDSDLDMSPERATDAANKAVNKCFP